MVTSFLATAILTYLCCCTKSILDYLDQKRLRNKPLNPPRFRAWSSALEQAIVSFSDQQLVTGISLIAGGLTQLQWGLPAYYFQAVGNLAWFSTFTHILTLALMRDKSRKKSGNSIKRIRVILMGVLVIMLVCIKAPMGYLVFTGDNLTLIPLEVP